MKKRWLSLFTSLGVAFSLLQPSTLFAQSDSQDVEIIVKMKKQVAKSLASDVHKKMKADIKHHNESLNFYTVKVHGKSAKEAVEEYSKLPDVEYAEPQVTVEGAWTPNDPSLATDQYAPQKIQLPEAWDYTRGKNNILVAVVDSGVKSDHPDLTGKVILGHDYIDGDDNPNDENGHGTGVTGIIGALTNNNMGIAGAVPNSKILAIRVLNASNSGTNDGVANGIIYAVDHGAKVINVSIRTLSDSQIIHDAVDYAWNHGGIVVAAAGNDGVTAPSYPAAYNNVVSVGGTDANDNKYSWTNFGNWVKIAAPAVNVYTTTNNNGYGSASGTSFAAPYVSGVAALLASQGRSNQQIRDAIYNTADNIPGTGTNWVYGRVNALKAVKYNVTYLSDMNWDTATIGYGTVHKDTSVDNHALRLNDTTYVKGIGTHANSEIVYNLNGQYATFTANVGVDDEVGANYGSVKFRVFLDNDVNPIFDSGTMICGSAAKSISVSVAGKNKLKLQVIDAGDGITNDHADWADAMLFK